MKTALLALAVTALSSTAMAQSVGDCDWRASAQNIVEPWEQNSRRFANGNVRLALLDTVEPAAASAHLLVISPPYGETGEPQCKVISLDGTLGFAGLDFSALKAAYDPSVGLIFSLPGMLYLPEKGFSNSLILNFTLNQATGEIATRMDLGRE